MAKEKRQRHDEDQKSRMQVVFFKSSQLYSYVRIYPYLCPYTFEKELHDSFIIIFTVPVLELYTVPVPQK